MNAYKEDEMKGKRTREGGREEKRKDQATGDIANTWSLVLDLRVNIRGVRYPSRHRSSGKPESRFCESRIFLEKN